MKTTIVLADDHRIVRDGLALLLEAQGTYEVVAMAANGLDALRSVEQNKPDLAIFDICMPDINGIVAAQQVRSRSPGTQVIILSMHADQSYVLRALRADVRGYVLKEAAVEDLLVAIESVMAGHRYLSQKLIDILVEHYIAQRPDNLGFQQNGVQLSHNERKILRLVADGRSSAQIGETLGLASTTVDTYRSRIMQKLKVSNTAGLIKFAIRSGLVNI